MRFHLNRKKSDAPEAGTQAGYLQTAPNTPPSLYEQAEGKFAEVRLLPRVQEAYLGQKAASHA